MAEGDKLYGRGTTDCLGHIAMLTLFLVELAKKPPTLEPNLMVVFIVSEECEDVPGIGVDGLAAAGVLDSLKHGVVLWIDASDSEPCIGSASALQWHLTAKGKRFHSGLPDKGINPLELVSEALMEIQERFYERFPPHEMERSYLFSNPSTMKPTQWSCTKGGINQIPPSATVSGDVRLTPFYKSNHVVDFLESIVKEMNDTKFSKVPTRGPCSKYELPDKIASLEMKFDDTSLMEGVACNIKSPAFLAFCEALNKVKGSVNPYSICGSLPLVKSMQDQGFDLHITGFGKMDAYHAENEYCLLSDMLQAIRVLSTFTSKMHHHYSKK